MFLTLKDKTWHNEEIYSLKFERPENFGFKPGQFLTVNLELDGKMEKRAYSFSSSPTEKEYLMFTIKKEKKVSKKLSEMESGDKLEARGPFGIFILDENFNDITFIAGGTGVTPFRCMIKYVADNKLNKNIKLLYSARTEKDLIFNEEFQKIENTNPNFRFIPTTTRDETFKGKKGRIDEKFLKDNVQNLNEEIFYICGPTAFVEAIKEALLKLNVENKKIKIDKWG